MWKDQDTEFYSKRDDDSAIGDSANNSAEEETTNSRQRSPMIDDVDEIQTEAYAQLGSKLNAKIPECLLKDSEESLQNCKKFCRYSQNNRSSKKRVITVLPKTAVLTEKPKENVKKDIPVQQDTSVLKAKLQYLFFEMKKLRELDHDILRKFIDLNGSIEEISVKIDENEANLKRSLIDGVVDDDVTMASSHSKIEDWDELDFVQIHAEKDEKVFNSKKIPASHSHSSSTKSNKNTKKKSPRSSSSESTLLREIYSIVNTNLNETKKPEDGLVQLRSSDDLIDVDSSAHCNKQHSHGPSKAIEMEKLCSKGYYRFKSPHPSPTPVRVALDAEEIWVKKETTNGAQDLNPSRKTHRSQRPKSATILAKKYSNEIQKQRYSRHNQLSSDGIAPDENYPVVRQNQWLSPERKDDKKVSDFKRQKDYKNLIGLSRVSGNSASPIRQKPVQKSSDSADSLNSSSSLTSSTTSPTQNPAHRNSKWSRFGLKRNSRSIDIHSNNNNNASFVNKNVKPRGVASPHSSKVVAVSYKQRTSETTQWTQSQDDITYL